MSNPKLNLEILNGPLDGQVITLEKATEWSKEGKGKLSFPWDEELGTPQARFFLEEESWRLEGHDAPHGTYRVNRNEKIRDRVPLESGDLLKACGTWLLVRQAG